MPRKPKAKRAKKASGKRKAEWYDTPEEGDEDSSEVSSASTPEPTAHRNGNPRKLSVVKEHQFAQTQAKSPFDALVGSLLASTESLPLEARRALQRVRQEQEGVEDDISEEQEDSDQVGESAEEAASEGASSANDEEEENDELSHSGEEEEPAFNCADPFSRRFSFTSPLPLRPASQRLENVSTRIANTDTALSVHGPLSSPLPLSAITLKSRLEKGWREYSSSMQSRYPELPTRDARGWSPLQAKIAPHMMGDYRDVVFTARALENARELRELYVVHVLNHALKSRDLVDRHTRAQKDFEKHAHQRREAERALKQNPKDEAMKLALSHLVEAQGPDSDAIRDQGFTRPRVLLLLPRRNSCLAAVTLMRRLLGGTEPVAWERFVEEYGPALEDEEANETDLLTGSHPALHAKQEAAGGRIPPPRPLDWQAEFHGNTDDEFKLGISLSGGGLKLYTDFYKSDLIIASPLGLRLATGLAIGAHPEVQDREDGQALDRIGLDNDEAEDEGGQQASQSGGESLDFLSSIEILVMDQVDAMHMQNWQHVEDLARALNCRPKHMREAMDFSRLAPRFLDGLAHEFRQNIVIAPFADPLTNALLARGAASGLGLSRNFAGTVTFRIASYPPAVSRGGLLQRFRRIGVDDKGAAESKSLAELRLEHFAENVLPALVKQSHVVLFVPSFFDLLRVKKLLGQVDGLKCGICSEYTPAKEVTRLRGDFFHGRLSMLVISERFHYHFRYRLRGMHRLVFYAPPSHHEFYAELVGLARSPSGQDECLVLFEKCDALELERIVGTSLARKMLKSDSQTTWALE